MTESRSAPVPVAAVASASAATKRSLVGAAVELFAARGYAATSLGAVVGAADVTKGALYHHFSGKQALFEAAFEQVATEADTRIRAAMDDAGDPWSRALAGLGTFLAVVQEPRYRRIVVQEGPAVLGHERFREQEERSTFATVHDLVDGILGSSDWADEELVHTFARIFYGAMASAGTTVSTAEDQEAAAGRVETAVGFLLDAFQVLVEGAGPDGPAVGGQRTVTAPPSVGTSAT